MESKQMEVVLPAKRSCEYDQCNLSPTLATQTNSRESSTPLHLRKMLQIGLRGQIVEDCDVRLCRLEQLDHKES